MSNGSVDFIDRQIARAAIERGGLASSQRGLSLVGLIFIGLIVVILTIVGSKTVPAVVEYLAIERDVQHAADSGQTVGSIRAAFDRYSTIDDITSIHGRDLDVTKDGGQVVVSYAYSYTIPLLSNVRLVIDFSGSSRDHSGPGPGPGS